MVGITFITGSTLGSAEYVAECLAEKLKLDDFKTEILHGPSFKDIPTEGIWIVVTSTYGAGDLPENLQPLFDEINERRPSLSHVYFGSIGIGNSEYDIYCGAIKKFEQLLIDCGAQRIGERLEIDVVEHELPEEPAEKWLENWKLCIKKGIT